MSFRLLIAASFSLLVFSGCQKAPQEVATHPLAAFAERNDDPLAAAADRFQRRLSADGTVPDRALLNAKAQRDTLVRTQAQNFQGNGASISWQWVGPGNIGGRLRPIVIHPITPNIMYVGSASGGIWKTLDGGQSWFPLDDFLPSLSIGDMVLHPEDSDTLYAGTGEGFFETVEGSSNTAAVRGAGIFLSTDAGSTWNQIPSTDNPDFYFVNRLEFDPSDSNTMLAATNTGVWRSTDSGQNWTLRESFHALDIKFNPMDPTRVVAGGHDTVDGPYFSVDGGLTWQLAAGAGGERQEIAWAPSEPHTVYAAVSDEGRIKIWRSTDGGQNYELRTQGSGIQTWAGYNNTIWVDPANAEFLVVGGVRLYRSNNGGVTTNQRFNAVHADMHRIVQHPGFDGSDNKVVYFATDGGIWRADDVYGTEAVDLNNNLGVTQFYGAGINPTTGHIVGGTQDNGTLFYRGDPQDWAHIFGGDGGYGAADPTDPDFFYGEVQRAYIHRSTNGGAGTSSYIYNGPNPIQDAGGLRSNFIPFFMLDPNDPNRMLVACERMWRSNNVKDSQPDWFAIKDSIDPNGRPFPGGKTLPSHFDENSPYNLSTIAVAKGNSDVIWAAHNNGSLYVTSDGTALAPTWARVDENGVGLPDRWISTIVIDPTNHSHIYIAFMGWEDDNLWETTDNGNTWRDISGTGPLSIPNAPISGLALQPHRPGMLYVGTDIGVFTSTDNGVMWTTQTDCPGTVPVEQLLWKNDNTLMAVTHGRGIFLTVEDAIFPQDLDVLLGFQTSGQLSDLFGGDDHFVSIDPARRATLSGQKVDIVLTSTSSTISPGEFRFRVQSRMNGGRLGDVYQTIKLWNYQTGQYELFDTRDAPIVDEQVVIAPTGDLSRFVQPLTNAIQANLTWRRETFIRRPFTWSVDIDEAVWLITE